MSPIKKFKRTLALRIYPSLVLFSAIVISNPQPAFSHIRCDSIFNSSASQISAISESTHDQVNETEAIHLALSDKSYSKNIPAFLKRVALHMQRQNIKTRIIDHPNQFFYNGQQVLQILPDSATAFGKMAKRLRKIDTLIILAPHLLLMGPRAAFFPEDRIIIVDSDTAVTGQISDSTLHEYRHALDFSALLNSARENILLASISSRLEIPFAPLGYERYHSVDEIWAHAVNARFEIRNLITKNRKVENAKLELQYTQRILSLAQALEFALKESEEVINKKEISKIEDLTETDDGIKYEKILLSTENGKIGLYRDNKFYNSLSLTIMPTGSDVRLGLRFPDHDRGLWRKIRATQADKENLGQVINPLIDRQYSQLKGLSDSIMPDVKEMNEIIKDGAVHAADLKTLFKHFRLIEQKLGKAVVNRRP